MLATAATKPFAYRHARHCRPHSKMLAALRSRAIKLLTFAASKAGYFAAIIYTKILRRILPTTFILRLEPKPPKTKTIIYLVRHGQSMHNISDVAQYGDTGADATLFDAPLSPHGKEQVAALKGNAELATAELCVTSPLTRAVQTLLGAFPEAPKGGCPPVELWPLAAEHLTDSCDIGSSPTALTKTFPKLKAPIAKLPEVWWYTDEETSRDDAEASRVKYRECGFMEPESTLIKRVDALVAAMRARPEERIALFGHSDFFNFLMERHCGVYDYWLENAEVYKITLRQDTEEVHMRIP